MKARRAFAPAAAALPRDVAFDMATGDMAIDAPSVSPETALDLLATAVLVLDERGHVQLANSAAENLLCLSRNRLLGHDVEAALGGNAGLREALERARRAGAAYTGHVVEIACGGNVQHLACSVTPVEAAGVRMVLELRPVEAQQRIAREERLYEQQQAHRELIRSLAHEIKNPLGGIRGAAQLLEGELRDPRLAEYTQVIIGEADRLQSLVNRLLTPHRLPVCQPTNLHEVLVRVKGVVQAEFPAIPVTCDFDISLPEVEADAEQLTQAFLNVVRNAAQALVDARDPQVQLVTRAARNVTLARARHRLAFSVAVIDNGPGVLPELRERIFFPLVSGREGGSGLGLTLAQTYIAQHAGTIECASVPGRTVFTIVLPFTGPQP